MQRESDSDRPGSIDDGGQINIGGSASGKRTDVIEADNVDAIRDGLKTSAETAVSAAEASEDPESVIRKALILIVDDDEPIHKVCARLLEREKYENVRHCWSGAEVLKEIFNDDGSVKEVPSLIVSDTQMPDMNGPQLHLKLKGLLGDDCPEYIALSGLDKSEKLWDPSVSFLMKPFSRTEIKNLIKEKLFRRLFGK